MVAELEEKSKAEQNLPAEKCIYVKKIAESFKTFEEQKKSAEQ